MVHLREFRVAALTLQQLDKVLSASTPACKFFEKKGTTPAVPSKFVCTRHGAQGICYERGRGAYVDALPSRVRVTTTTIVQKHHQLIPNLKETHLYARAYVCANIGSILITSERNTKQHQWGVAHQPCNTKHNWMQHTNI